MEVKEKLPLVQVNITTYYFCILYPQVLVPTHIFVFKLQLQSLGIIAFKIYLFVSRQSVNATYRFARRGCGLGFVLVSVLAVRVLMEGLSTKLCPAVLCGEEVAGWAAHPWP